MSKKLVLIRCKVIKQLIIETDMTDDEIYESNVEDLRQEGVEDETEISEIDSEVDQVRDCPECAPYMASPRPPSDG